MFYEETLGKTWRITLVQKGAREVSLFYHGIFYIKTSSDFLRLCVVPPEVPLRREVSTSFGLCREMTAVFLDRQVAVRTATFPVAPLDVVTPLTFPFVGTRVSNIGRKA